MNENIIGDREYTVGSLKEFLNSSWIDDDMPVKLNMNQWNFIKLYPKFSVKQLTSCGEPYINLGCREMDEDYNMIWEKWRDRGIENNKLRKENRQLKCLIDDYESREEHDKETINDLHNEFMNVKKENEELRLFREDCIMHINSQIDFNNKKYAETRDTYFRDQNIDFWNLKVELGIDNE